MLEPLKWSNGYTGEAKFLDDINFDGWFSLLHPDISYQMPVRVNKEGIERPGLFLRICLLLMMTLSC